MPIDKLRYGTSDLVILAFLSRCPTYGYDLWERLNSLPTISFSQALLYPALHRLASHGYLIPRRDDRRIYYSLTSKGQSYLSIEITKWHALSELIEAIVSSQKSQNKPGTQDG